MRFSSSQSLVIHSAGFNMLSKTWVITFRSGFLNHFGDPWVRILLVHVKRVGRRLVHASVGGLDSAKLHPFFRSIFLLELLDVSIFVENFG